MRSSYVSLAFAALLTAACGGKVAIDQPSAAGGAGGGSTTTTTTTGTTTITTTTTTSTGTGTVTGPCGSLTLPPACTSCTEANCCAELAACDVGTPCWNQLMCLVDCPTGTPGCDSSCANDLDPTLQAFAQCLSDQCSNPGCQNPGPEICDSGLTAWQGSQCGICLSIGCCSAYEACDSDPLCVKCMSIPNAPPDCLQDASFVAARTCGQKACPHVCP